MDDDSVADQMQDHWLRCIQRVEPVLRDMDPAKDPLSWAANQRDLGCCYLKLQRGSVSANLMKAIVCFEVALQVYTEAEHSPFWAATQSNLGDAHVKLAYLQNRTDHLRLAIECYEALLRTYTQQSFPRQWTMTQNKLRQVRAALAQTSRA